MRVPRIYTPQTLQVGQQLALGDQAAQHLIKVLRCKPGTQLELFNGDGNAYGATLASAGKREALVQIEQMLTCTTESPLHTHLGQVISRGDRMDYAIQKATELGVTCITPLFSERCEVRLNPERQAKRIEHWRHVAISAAEQCGRVRIPEIRACQPLASWMSETREDELALVLHHRDQQHLGALPAPSKVRLLIGPEGGLNPDEITLAQAQGFLSTTFGPRVWRTETAPVAALSIVQWLWGDFRNSTS